MALPLFELKTTNTLSLDTDSGRINDYTSIVKDNSGRLIVFYEKEWTSGRLSDTLVLKVSGLDIQIQAGNGEINGIPVSWMLTNLTVPASSYSLIYVTNAGIVQQTTSPTSTLIRDSIVLAFVGSGISDVVYIDLIEKTGFYIFSKRQIFSGGNWIWDDYEYRLNVGRDPTASYDSINDKVYLTFSKDGSSYVRIFDLTDPLTWEYLPHYSEASFTLYPETGPQATSIMKLGSGRTTQSPGQLFPLDAIGVGYKVDGSVQQYVHIPYLNSTWNQYVLDGTIYCEIFEKVGPSYVLIDSFQIGKQNTWSWRIFTGGYNKTFYVGVRLKHSLYVEEEFTTDPSNYIAIYPYQYLISAELNDSVWQARCDEEIYDLKLGAGSGFSTKVTEYDQLYKFQDDSNTLKLGCGNGIVTKVTEYDQLFKFYDDLVVTLKLGAGNSLITKTS